MAIPVNSLASVNYNPMSRKEEQFDGFSGTISKKVPTQLTIKNTATQNKSSEVVNLIYVYNGLDFVWRVEPEKYCTENDFKDTVLNFFIDLFPRSKQCREFESELRCGKFDKFIKNNLKID